MAITGEGAIKREEQLLFANVGTGSTREWEVIGERIEELIQEMNPNIETGSDVLGNNWATLDRYEPSTSVEPFMAKRESKLFAILHEIWKYRKTLTDVELEFLMVDIFDGAEDTKGALLQKGIVAIQSYGGDTTGLGIPFNINWTGPITYGTFDGDTKTFTPQA